MHAGNTPTTFSSIDSCPDDFHQQSSKEKALLSKVAVQTPGNTDQQKSRSLDDVNEMLGDRNIEIVKNTDQMETKDEENSLPKQITKELLGEEGEVEVFHAELPVTINANENDEKKEDCFQKLPTIEENPKPWQDSPHFLENNPPILLGSSPSKDIGEQSVYGKESEIFQRKSIQTVFRFLPFKEKNTKSLDSPNRNLNGKEQSFLEEKKDISCTRSRRSKERRVVQFQDMPKHLQFNPYIQSGYRPLTSTWGCMKSLFYFHNETFNIITHSIPILYILINTPRVTNWSKSELRFLSWCHIAGSISPWIGSCIYHLFMSMNKDRQFYLRLLQIDMLGIWVCQCFGAMPMVFAFSHCFSNLIRRCCISLYCIVSLWCLYKAMLAYSPWERRFSFSLPFSIRVILCCLRSLRIGGGDPNALLYLTLQDLLAVIGATIGALQIPEKWFPGYFDNCWNSHNIMHILVVTAVYYMHQATMKDLFWMSTVKCGS